MKIKNTQTVSIVPLSGLKFRTMAGLLDILPDLCEDRFPVLISEGDDARHVHFINSNTEVADGHFHEVTVAMLIVNSIGD